MDLKTEVKQIAGAIGAEIKEDGNLIEFESLIAERKAFLTSKKLTYRAKVRIDQEKREVRFTELLKESGFGLSASAGDGEMSSGFGFKTESYNTLSGAREGSIQEQSDLFGKKYEYKFEWGTIRKQIEQKAAEAGYAFSYHITGIGV